MAGALIRDDFMDGYCDGRDPQSPEPSLDRSSAYRHCFKVGRSEMTKFPIRADARNKQRELCAPQ